MNLMTRTRTSRNPRPAGPSQPRPALRLSGDGSQWASTCQRFRSRVTGTGSPPPEGIWRRVFYCPESVRSWSKRRDEDVQFLLDIAGNRTDDNE